MGTNPIGSDVISESERIDQAATDPTQTSTGIDENVAGALSYLFGMVTGVIFYVVEPDNEFVRSHAAQSMATFGLVLVASIGLSILGMVVRMLFFTGSTGGFLAGSIISLLLTVVWLAVWVGAFGLWLYLMVRAYQGKTSRVPIAAGIANKLV